MFEIRAADELYFQLDEALAGARINPEYFPDLPDGFEEALVPLVIGDPGIRLPGYNISGQLRYAIAQGRVPDPTAVHFQGVSRSFTTVRQSYGGAVHDAGGRSSHVLGTIYGIELFELLTKLWDIDRYRNPTGSQLITRQYCHLAIVRPTRDWHGTGRTYGALTPAVVSYGRST